MKIRQIILEDFRQFYGRETIDFSVTGTIDIASQLPTITDNVTINGAGQITIDAGNGTDNTFNTQDGYRIFDRPATPKAVSQRIDR